ncbi:MAG: transcription antitermination factor NusB [Elusimicrobiaceae bacterium]|uniref:Transcription antitermination protein NusB n=1 Tax=Candidatus Avelusimicrobium gallicola TaxID=2562704 RepID=A0A928DPE6_9BACT|nr:transcription antitermination factor NusB [Elusimicrobium sp.]MBQ9971182.1 transcription antitermination factor NusB [Elusimicrobiaceae bacterium]
MSNRRMARECALQSLYYADNLVTADENNNVSRYAADFKKDLGDFFPFCEDLITGTTANLQEIDKLVSAYAKNWTVARMSAVDRSILRMATYEMVFSPERTPVPAIIDEAIELAKKYSTENSSKFINGLLDQLKKERK